jgi:transcriptional regulator with XRE-family HTH domain
VETPLGTHRFQRAVAGARPIVGAQLARCRTRTIANNIYSTPARRLRGRLISSALHQLAARAISAATCAHYAARQLDASRLAATFQPWSRAQLAEALGIPQRTLSLYEREAGDIPAGLAPAKARALGVSVDELLGEAEKKRRAGVGPTGRMRRLSETASKPPRSQHEKIAANLEALVNQRSDREAWAEKGQTAIVFF